MNIRNNIEFSNFKNTAKLLENIDYTIKNQTPEKHNITRKNENIKKAAVLTAALVGMLVGLKLVGKQQKMDVFLPKNYKKIDYNTKALTTIAGCSLFGGVGTGIATDRKNTKNKLREAVQQMIGNILFPIFAVTKGNDLFDNVKDKIKMPQLSSNKGIAKHLNYALKQLPNVVVTTVLLAAGLWVGNKVANFTNNLIFGKKEDRKLKFSDLSVHIDDACLATTLVAKGTSLGSKIAHIIPPALIVPGYIAGSQSENHHH